MSLIKDIFLIVAISLGLAFVFNSIQEKPLPLIPEAKAKVSDKEIADALLSENVNQFETEKTLTYEQVKSLMNDERVQLIDARRGEDYEKEHIGNSINIFPHDDEPVFMQKVFTLPQDKVYVIYCNGGTCDLSHEVAKVMKQANHKKIFIYEGGWEDWEKNGKGK